jgi:hypothetical protein
MVRGYTTEEMDAMGAVDYDPAAADAKDFGTPLSAPPTGSVPYDAVQATLDALKMDSPPPDDQGFWSAVGGGIVGSFLDVGSAAMGIEESIATHLYGSENAAAVFANAKANVQAVRGRFTPDAKNTTAQAGFMAGNIAGSLVQGAATAGVGPAIGLAGRAALVLPFAREFLVSGDQAYDQIRMAGGSERQGQAGRFLVGSIGGLLGTLEVNNLVKFNLVNAEARKRVVQLASQHAFKEAGKQGMAISKDLLALSLANGLQEAAQEGIAIGVPAAIIGDVPKTPKGDTDWSAVFTRLGLAGVAGAAASGAIAGSRLASAPGPSVKITGDVAMPLADADSLIRQRRMDLDKTHPDRVEAQKWADIQKRPTVLPDEGVGEPGVIPRTPEEQIIYPAENSSSYLTLAQQYEMDIPDAQRFHEAVESEALLDAPLTPAERLEVMRTHIGDMQMTTVFGGMRKEAVDDVLSLHYVLGGTPQNPELRAQYLANMANQATTRTRQLGKADKMTAKGKDANFFNPWSSSTHSFEELDVVTGKPVSRLWARMTDAEIRAKAQVDLELRDRLNKAGLTDKDMMFTVAQDELIQTALGTGDDSLVPDNLRPQFDFYKKWFAEERAVVAQVKWDLWDQLGLTPSQIDPAFSKQLLQEGRAAKANGNLAEWLKTQTWTARENYYMSEFEGEDVTDTLAEGFIPKEFRGTTSDNKKGTTPIIREAMTRKNKDAIWKKGPVLFNVTNHMKRIAVTRAIMGDLPKLWGHLKASGISKTDAARIKSFTDNMMGRTMDYKASTAILKSARRLFWRSYFGNPIRAANWMFKNVLQEAYILHHLSPVSIARSLVSLTTRAASEDERAAYAYAHGLMQQSNDGIWESRMHDATPDDIKNPLLRGLASLADRLGRTANKSELYIREAAWRVYYRAAEEELAGFKEGTVPWDRIRKNLRLDTMTKGRQNEVLHFVDQGKYREAAAMIAREKVSSTHFRYELSQRSQVEQDPLERGLIGLYTYPRGIFEMFYHNGLKPMAEGLASGDRSKYKQGFGAIMGGIAGILASREIYERAVGKDLGVVGYSPLDPGISKITELIKDLQFMEQQGAGWERYLALVGNEVEFVIPLADWYVDYYEAENDVKGVKFWKLLSTQAKSLFEEQYGIPWKNAERTAYQKILHTMLGGFETPPTEAE